jgi:hypothetical protein
MRLRAGEAGEGKEGREGAVDSGHGLAEEGWSKGRLWAALAAVPTRHASSPTTPEPR